MRMPCLNCGKPSTNGSRCPKCQLVWDRAKDRNRGTTSQRGYGSNHTRRALALRKLALPCSLCGQPIDYTLHGPHPESYTAHHVTQDKTGELQPAHRRCNEQHGQPDQ